MKKGLELKVHRDDKKGMLEMDWKYFYCDINDTEVNYILSEISSRSKRINQILFYFASDKLDELLKEKSVKKIKRLRLNKKNIACRKNHEKLWGLMARGEKC